MDEKGPLPAAGADTGARFRILPAILVLGAAMAGCFGSSPGEDYLLMDDDLPPGLRVCEPSESMRAEGFGENPGPMPPGQFAEVRDSMEEGMPRPERIWMQYVGAAGRDECVEGDAEILLAEFASAGDVEAILEAEPYSTGLECYTREEFFFHEKVIIYVNADREVAEDLHSALVRKTPDLLAAC